MPSYTLISGRHAHLKPIPNANGWQRTNDQKTIMPGETFWSAEVLTDTTRYTPAASTYSFGVDDGGLSNGASDASGLATQLGVSTNQSFQEFVDALAAAIDA